MSRNCRSIQCDICDSWIHQSKCSGLTHKQFDTFCMPNSDSWFCPSCISTTLPFPLDASDSVNPDSNLSDELKSLLTNLNNVVTGLARDDVSEDECEIQFHSNSCSYLDCSELNCCFENNHKPLRLSSQHCLYAQTL